MKRRRLLSAMALLVVSPVAWTRRAIAAAPMSLADVKTPEDLDAFIAATTGDRQAVLRASEKAILDAIERRRHVEAVTHAVTFAQGKVEAVNLTPAEIVGAFGPAPQFDTLRLVDLAIPNAGPHAHREVDPFDAAFFEHLGHISSLESLNVIATKLSDDWIAPLGKLTNLKTLRFTNNGKLTDAGLEKLAGLKQVEQFSFVGTKMQGHAFEKFEGWTKLTRSSFRGSSLDDVGLRWLCERFSNLESLSLAHAHFSDAGAAHLEKLTRLKGLELGSREATLACMRHVATLPLEYLQIGDGLDSPAGVAHIKDMPTLRRLTLTDSSPLSDADLQVVAGMRQLEQLELGKVPLTVERADVLKGLTFLKALRLVPGREPYSPETQAKIKALLPKVELKFQ